MDSVLQDAGTRYAETLPAAVGVPLAILVVTGIWAFKFWQEGEAWQQFVAVVLAGISVAVLISIPPALSVAQEECKRVWREEGEIAFMVKKCSPVSECDDESGPFASLLDGGPCGPPRSLLDDFGL